MNGCVYRQPDGSWWFVFSWAGVGMRWAFPFEHGPSLVCDAPPAHELHHGEPATVTHWGSVLVDRREERWFYAGRIDVNRRADGEPLGSNPAQDT